MSISKLRLLSVTLVIEIAIIVVGICYYKQGPVPYTMALTASETKSLSVENGKWLYYPLAFPTGRIHAKFALNMTVSAGFSFSEPGLNIYLLNATQFQQWNDTRPDYLLTREYPSYNFSAMVEPDDYYLAINASHLETGYSIEVSSDIVVVAQNFDYARVWPGLYLVLAGVIAANVNVPLMRREDAFAKIDSYIRAMYVPRVNFPGKSSYTKYSLEVYDTFTKPLTVWIVQFTPALFVAMIVFRSWPMGTSPFVSVAWDHVAFAAVTLYFILVCFIALSIFLIVCFVPRTADFAWILSERLRILNAVDVRAISKMNTLNLSDLRKRKFIPIFSFPLILFGAIIFLTPVPQEVKLPYHLWVALILLLAYYGLAFAYINSISLKRHLYAHYHKQARKHLGVRLRLFSLIQALTTTLSDAVLFMAIISLLVSLIFYVAIPIISSSLAVKYGLASTLKFASIDIFILIFEIILIGLLLIWSIFYGITGYIVPELLDRGIRGSFVGLIALSLTFFTERAFSEILNPYLSIDWAWSLLFSFPVFVLVLIFEKFYRRMLQRLEDTHTSPPVISQT